MIWTTSFPEGGGSRKVARAVSRKVCKGRRIVRAIGRQAASAHEGW